MAKKPPAKGPASPPPSGPPPPPSPDYSGAVDSTKELLKNMQNLSSEQGKVLKDKSVHIKGNVNIKVDGSYTLNVDGPIVINGSTVNINNGSMGAARIGDTADTGDPGGSPGSNKIESGSSTVFIGD